MSRRESWREQLLPGEIVLLTVGADTQQDRLEAVLLGWTNSGQCLVICQRVFDGSPDFKQVWDTFDDWLLKPRQTEIGATLHIKAVCVDSGGSSTQSVYEFATQRSARHVYAIKGAAGPKPALAGSCQR